MNYRIELRDIGREKICWRQNTIHPTLFAAEQWADALCKIILQCKNLSSTYIGFELYQVKADGLAAGIFRITPINEITGETI